MKRKGREEERKKGSFWKSSIFHPKIKTLDKSSKSAYHFGSVLCETKAYPQTFLQLQEIVTLLGTAKMPLPRSNW